MSTSTTSADPVLGALTPEHRFERAQNRSGLPALVWLSWAAAAAAAVQLAPNPVYVSVVVAIAAVAVQAHGDRTRLGAAFPVLVVAGVVFAVMRLVLTALTTHAGEDVLFALPEVTLPRLLGGFVVGGGVELPVVARAAAEGWAIVGVITAFAAFNAVVSHHELTAGAPRAFYELGLAVTVAIAFVPSTIAAVSAVRDADRARTGGRVVRRGRLVRQVVPVLESGMERAVRLAESMDSRGFGRDASRRESAGGWCGLAALVLLATSFVALVGRRPLMAASLACAGGAAVVGAVALTSIAARRVRYRHRRLSARDWATAAIPWATPLVLGVLSAAGDDSLVWPGDRVLVPSVGLLPVIAFAALVVPAAIEQRR